MDAINRQLALGFEIGPMTPLAGQTAKLLCELTGMERATFCNTGSEAVMPHSELPEQSRAGTRLSSLREIITEHLTRS